MVLTRGAALKKWYHASLPSYLYRSLFKNLHICPCANGFVTTTEPPDFAISVARLFSMLVATLKSTASAISKCKSRGWEVFERRLQS
ncbi:hypothetical protein EUGRSUZ_H02951 [Eucalyptus grandis]|uniref:Uncharacterized protein n=2 Tax=Eucalyptus grandis TaxID=71139 RepID=A0ACC3JT71_EUCGR|nr:hypothetical protein EUGRSUZ_H02951 [Eucalyptus grandis]